MFASWEDAFVQTWWSTMLWHLEHTSPFRALGPEMKASTCPRVFHMHGGRRSREGASRTRRMDKLMASLSEQTADGVNNHAVRVEWAAPVMSRFEMGPGLRVDMDFGRDAVTARAVFLVGDTPEDISAAMAMLYMREPTIPFAHAREVTWTIRTWAISDWPGFPGRCSFLGKFGKEWKRQHVRGR